MKLKTLSMIMGVMILAACTEDRLPKPSPIGENERVVLRVAHFLADSHEPKEST